MNTYDVGDVVRLNAIIKDEEGDLTDPPNLTFKVRRPDGTTGTYVYLTDVVVVRASVGSYYLLYTTTMARLHYYSYYITGSQAVFEEAPFNVRVKRTA